MTYKIPPNAVFRGGESDLSRSSLKLAKRMTHKDSGVVKIRSESVIEGWDAPMTYGIHALETPVTKYFKGNYQDVNK